MSWLHKWFGLGKREDTFLTLKLRLARWRHLLRAEESCLTLLGDIREKLSGEYVLDRQYILSSLGQVFQKAYQVAYDMGVLCDLKEVQMYPWLDGLKERVAAYLRTWPLIKTGPSLIPLPGNDFVKSDQVGEMAAELMEMKRKGLMDIPQGFVITIQGFLQLLHENKLNGYFQPFFSGRKTDWREGYQSLAQGLLQTTIPEELKAAIQEAIQSLSRDGESCPSLILWPSPLKSETLPGFPLPTWTWPGGSLDSFWDLLRSLWSEVYLLGAKPAAAYGRYPLLSAVICQRQISGGEGYGVQTLDPAHPEGGEILLYRLADAAASGSFNRRPSQEIRFSRNSVGRELGPEPLGGGGGNLPKRQNLAQLSLRMENYFKRALEILWEEDREGNDYLRQLRFLDIPLEVRSVAAEKISLLLKGWPRYYSQQGKIIFRGIACGLAAHLKPGQDLTLFPEGGILVAREWCPGWNAIAPKISAILMEQGASSSLAFLARSRRIPAISQIPGLMEKIPDHAVITVDAEDNFIYENRVDSLLDAQLLEGHRLEDEPEYLLLDGVLRAVDHSYLTGEGGAPPGALEGCRTILEGIQWARRQAMAVLFDPAAWQHLVRDQWALPVGGGNHFSIYAIDLDKALAGSKPAAPLQAAIHRAEISSTPWCPIWQNLNNLPFFERTLASQEETPIFLIFTENTLFLFQSSAAGKFIIDAAITGVPELNHLFFYREEGEQEAKPGTRRPGESRALGGTDKTSIYEHRSFGKSDFDTKEQLKRSELRWDREHKNNPRS